MQTPSPEHDPHIHAICVVQNEQDVIADCIGWAACFCDAITVWDLGSVDGTLEILEGLASEAVRVTHRPDLPYSRAVRPAMLESVRGALPPGSWLYVLDADEFFVGDPRPLLADAARAGAHTVRTWQLNAVPTPDDLSRLEAMGREAWEALPLFERLPWFRIVGRERRFVRCGEELRWSASDGRSRMRLADGGSLRIHRRAGLMRHFRWRSPSQVKARFETRQVLRADGYPGFHYDRTERFEDYVLPVRQCRRWPAEGGPPGVSARDRLRYLGRRLRNVVRKGSRRLGPRSG